jgi:hypothetical protein
VPVAKQRIIIQLALPDKLKAGSMAEKSSYKTDHTVDGTEEGAET